MRRISILWTTLGLLIGFGSALAIGLSCGLAISGTMHAGVVTRLHQSQADGFRELPGAPVVMLGDSLTDYGEWSELLGPEVANRGIAGDTTEGVLARLDGVPRNAKLVFLLIGTNDLAAGQSVEAVATHTQEIVSRLPGHVVLQSIPHCLGAEINTKIDAVNARNAGYCKTSGRCRFLDIASVIDPQMSNSVDGVHLTPAAYRAWAERVRPLLAELKE